MYLSTFGPFTLDLIQGRVTKYGQDLTFWDQLDEQAVARGFRPGELAMANGCYVFGLSQNGAMQPWYVADCLLMEGYRRELFDKEEVAIYNQVLEGHGGTPFLFLFPAMTSTGRFSKHNYRSVNMQTDAASMLVGFAYAANPNLINASGSYAVKVVQIEGILGTDATERGSESAAAARQLLGLRVDT